MYGISHMQLLLSALCGTIGEHLQTQLSYFDCPQTKSIVSFILQSYC